MWQFYNKVDDKFGSKHLKKMKQLGQEDVCKNEDDAKLSYEVAHR